MLNTEYISSKEKKQNRVLTFNWRYLLPVVLAFLISRASLVDKLTPFGIAFITAYILAGKFNMYMLASSILGILSIHGLAGMDYIITLVILAIIYRFVEKLRQYSLIVSAIITSCIFAAFMSLYGMLFKEFLFYDFLIIGFEALIVFTLTYIFSYTIDAKFQRLGANERLISIFITLALVLSGFNELNIYGISIKNLIGIVIILYTAYKKGAFVGSAVGITLGIISYVSQPQMPFILSIYGLAGLLAGIFKEQGKIGSILGFVLGNGIISFYINGYGISFINLRELILSILIFTLSYKAMDKLLSGYIEDIAVNRKEKAYSLKKDEMIVNKLNEISEVFNEIGETFRKSVEENNINVKEVYGMIDIAANNVCANCAMRNFCWGKRFYTTYNSMFKITSLLEEKAPITKDTLPKAIQDYCIKKEDVVKELKVQYEMLKLNNMWKDRIIQNRLLVSEQLEGVSNIIKDMVKDIYINPVFKEDVEEILYNDLRKNKIDVVDVIVAELYKDNIEVYLEVENVYADRNREKDMVKIVSESLGMPMKLEKNIDREKKEKHIFKLIKSNRYSALTEVASKANSKNNISGDSFTFGEGHNIHFAAISDGMGIGKKASKESNMAINLLEKFLEAKFDKELALKTINSILMLKSNDEMCTTLDISMIDLYSGKLQLIKTGAPATFIKKKDRVEVINSQSLPVGILEDVDFNIYEEYLEDGDIIIMMSDGVLEANAKVDNTERWIKDLIAGIGSLNPKIIAEEIIKVASELTADENRDDMTVLVTKVWKTV